MATTRRSISAFEAPALIDVHPTLSRLALYERLNTDNTPPSRPGLQTCLESGAITFAQDEYRLEPPIRRTWELQPHPDITSKAAGWMTNDDKGPIVYIFAHIPQFVHQNAWGRTGVPPIQFKVMAQWVMMHAGVDRAAFLVLVDKAVRVYEVQRDENVINRLIAGCIDMATALSTNTPPPADAVAEETKPAAQPTDDPNSVNLDEIAQRWLDASILKATSANDATMAEAAEAAAGDVLRRHLAPGETHVVNGTRIIHNATRGRLIQEQIDELYF